MNNKIERTEEKEDELVSLIAQRIAGDGSEQYEIARYGFLGVSEMDDQQFQNACTAYGIYE